MAKVYLICGSTGAGKTYYSEKLKKLNPTIVFSIDKWMKLLFWSDAPKDNFEWVIERIARCETMIKDMTLDIYKENLSVILDLGFSEPQQRNQFYQWLKINKIPYELHYLNIHVDIRWQRVQQRNQSLKDNSIFVDKKTFDWMEDYFQAPSENELKENNGIVITD